jgi:hypothetical protein
MKYITPDLHFLFINPAQFSKQSFGDTRTQVQPAPNEFDLQILIPDRRFAQNYFQQGIHADLSLIVLET